AEAQLAAAQANRASSATNLATASDHLTRLQALHSEGGVSDQQLIQTRGQAQAAEAGVRAAEAQIAQARAAIALAQSQLSYTTIAAPFAGVVTKKQAEVGTMLQPMAPVFTVASVKQLEVKVPVGQAFLGGVHPGQSATFHVPTYPGRAFSARVQEVAPTVDTGTRTATVTLAIPNEEGLLAPGMFARVSLPTASREDVVVVPETAVVSNGEREFVFVVAAGTAERREVKTGLREGQRVELTSGVEPGDAIVTLGQGMLEHGDSVKVVNEGKEAIQ
ncbi:MAG: efflux RND transporter periplasmic adaptor subunit, partial [Candidatus Sericytochromatia bacterium]